MVWNQTLPDDLKLLIFDTGFIHRNVFTGLEIERENKKNITDFILGEESVQSAEKVEKLRQESRKLTTQTTNLEKESFKNINNLDDFIKLEVSEPLDDLKEELEDIIVKGKEKRETSKNIDNLSNNTHEMFMRLKM